jgi:hypothetical protein
METFCVLEPKLNRTVFSLKIPKNGHLPTLANKVHERH